MAARPSAPACQAQLYRLLTDWFLAGRHVRGGKKTKKKTGRGERREMRWGGSVNDEDSVRRGRREQPSWRVEMKRR